MKAMAMAESEILPTWAAPPLSAFFSGGPQEKEARPREPMGAIPFRGG